MKQMKHVSAVYLRQVWEMSVWLYEGQHGFTVLCTEISSVPIASPTPTNFLLTTSLAHGVF